MERDREKEEEAIGQSGVDAVWYAELFLLLPPPRGTNPRTLCGMEHGGGGEAASADLWSACARLHVRP